MTLKNTLNHFDSFLAALYENRIAFFIFYIVRSFFTGALVLSLMAMVNKDNLTPLNILIVFDISFLVMFFAFKSRDIFYLLFSLLISYILFILLEAGLTALGVHNMSNGYPSFW